jgi:thioredoxin reductase (NADPH)
MKQELPGNTQRTDVLIVGAGPAGLTAAVYLARFRREVIVVDAGGSRALRIPVTRNYPGFPLGISGAQLLFRLREQAQNFGVSVTHGTVESLQAAEGDFIAVSGDTRIVAKRVLLATGVVDKVPSVGGMEALSLEMRLRWCPICDAFELIGTEVGVLSDAQHGPGHALFLRTYTPRVTLFVEEGAGELSDAAREGLRAGAVRVIEEPILKVDAEAGSCLDVHLRNGTTMSFDALYPMLGSVAQDRLAVPLGAQCSGGELVVDHHQQTSVPGLYAAGDVVKALNQMSVGVGHAAVAATAIHNSLPPKMAVAR